MVQLARIAPAPGHPRRAGRQARHWCLNPGESAIFAACQRRRVSFATRRRCSAFALRRGGDLWEPSELACNAPSSRQSLSLGQLLNQWPPSAKFSHRSGWHFSAASQCPAEPAERMMFAPIGQSGQLPIGASATAPSRTRPAHVQLDASADAPCTKPSSPPIQPGAAPRSAGAHSSRHSSRS